MSPVLVRLAFCYGCLAIVSITIPMYPGLSHAGNVHNYSMIARAMQPSSMQEHLYRSSRPHSYHNISNWTDSSTSICNETVPCTPEQSAEQDGRAVSQWKPLSWGQTRPTHVYTAIQNYTIAKKLIADRPYIPTKKRC